MAFSDFERKRIEKILAAYLERMRPPPQVRSEVDLLGRIERQNVEIVETRAAWDGGPRMTQRPIARATFNQGTRTWKVYWQRPDLKWHRYEPAPEVASLEEFLSLVEDDAHACFFG